MSDNSDSDNVEFYKQFDPLDRSPTSLRQKMKTVITAVPLAITCIFHYITFGSPVEDWTLLYYTVTTTLKGVLTKSRQGEVIPNVNASQRNSQQPNSIPKDGTIITDFYKRNKKVVEFIKNTCPGEWPSHADDLASPIDGEWIYSTDSNHDYVIFSLHGGAYVLGSAQMQRPLAYRIVKASKSKVFSINYRLAPQNPFPCALIDAVSGYMFLLQNYDPSKIVLTGESAGGGLALATLMAIRDMGLPLPAGAYCISPWCDLTHSFSSYDLNDSLDFLPPRVPDPRLQDRIHYYTTNENLKDPFVSPYWSKNLAGLPPLLITCGGVEKLVDEIIAFGEKAVKHDPNNRITLEVYKNHVHVFQVFHFTLAAKSAINRGGQWIQSITNRPSNFDVSESNSTRINFDFKGIEYSRSAL